MQKAGRRLTSCLLFVSVFMDCTSDIIYIKKQTNISNLINERRFNMKAFKRSAVEFTTLLLIFTPIVMIADFMY